MKFRTFQEQFHAAILAGTKIGTIRDEKWCKVGERVAHRYWTAAAYRSPMGILSTAVVVKVAPVSIDLNDGVEVFLDNKMLSTEEVDQLALQEGFPTRGDMALWFHNTHGLPYDGWLVQWDPTTLEIPS